MCLDYSASTSSHAFVQHSPGVGGAGRGGVAKTGSVARARPGKAEKSSPFKSEAHTSRGSLIFTAHPALLSIKRQATGKQTIVTTMN